MSEGFLTGDEFSNLQTQQVSNLQAQLQAQSQQLQGKIETQNHSFQAVFEYQVSRIRGLLAMSLREDGE